MSQFEAPYHAIPWYTSRKKSGVRVQQQLNFQLIIALQLLNCPCFQIKTMWNSSHNPNFDEPLNLSVMRGREEGGSEGPPPAHQGTQTSSQVDIEVVMRSEELTPDDCLSFIQMTNWHFPHPPGLQITPVVPEVVQTGGLALSSQSNPVLSILQQRIRHDTELLSRMMSQSHQPQEDFSRMMSHQHQDDLSTMMPQQPQEDFSVIMSQQPQDDSSMMMFQQPQADLSMMMFQHHQSDPLVVPGMAQFSSPSPGCSQEPSYSYRARISDGGFVSDSKGNLLVTPNTQLQGAGARAHQSDILDLTVSNTMRLKVSSPSSPPGPRCSQLVHDIVKSISLKQERPVFWNLLWALLENQTHSSIICWSNAETLKFKIINFQILAEIWGVIKSNRNMSVGNIAQVVYSEIFGIEHVYMYITLFHILHTYVHCTYYIITLQILDLYLEKGLLSKSDVDHEYQIMQLPKGNLSGKKKKSNR